jgi:hypothetical protein
LYRKDSRIVVANIEHGFQPEEDDPAYADMSRLGTGIYRSEDGGASWTFVNRSNPRPFYYSHIWIGPNDPNRIFQLAENARVSDDGGRSFSRQFPGIEGDFHALWVDPNDSDHLYVGNDKGASVSFDGGRSFILLDNIDAARFYAIAPGFRARGRSRGRAVRGPRAGEGSGVVVSLGRAGESGHQPPRPRDRKTFRHPLRRSAPRVRERR